MTEKGLGIPDSFLHARFVRALLDEYCHIKPTLQTITNRDRAEIIRVVGTRCSTLPQTKGSKRSCRPPEQLLFREKAAAGEVRDEVVAAVAGAPRAVAAAGTAARWEVAAASVVPAVVATAAVANLIVAVGDATGRVTSGRSAPRKKATS